MRQYSKKALLLGPLLVASAMGCQSVSVGDATTNHVGKDVRARQMMGLAAQYEANGRPELAGRIYEYVLFANPGDSQAQQRLASLTRQHQAPATNAPAAAPPAGVSPRMEELLAASSSPAPETSAPEALAAVTPTVEKVATPAPAAPELPEVHPSAPPALQEWSLAEHQPEQLAAPEPPQMAVTESAGWRNTNPEHFAEWASEADTIPAPTAELALAEAPAPAELPEVHPQGVSALAPTELRPMEQFAANGWAAVPELQAPPTATAEDQKIVVTAAAAPDLVSLSESLPTGVQSLVTQLEQGNAQERAAALIQLSDMGGAARSATVAVHAHLTDPDPVVAVYAAGALRSISGDAWESVHKLTDYLRHPNGEVVRLSAYLLGQMGPEAMDAQPALAKLRDSRRGLTSLHAAEALCRIAPDDPRSVKMLVAATHSKDRDERWFATVSLGSVQGAGQSEAVKALQAALFDAETDIRAAAALSLGGHGDKAHAAVGDLELAARCDKPEVRAAAETALACLTH